MSVIQNNIDLVNATLTVKVSKEDYSEKYDKALKIARKKINVPGFRVGMAPMGMVKKMYGPTILVDEINKIVSEELYNYINENKLNILGEPLPNENSKVDAFNEGDDFEFVFDIALAPEFKVEWNGNLYQFHLTMSAAPMEATVVVVENATVEIEKYLLFGDMYDYALKMTGEWVNDGLT